MKREALKPYKRIGPLFETKTHLEVKDPCIIHDGATWHIYGSGVSRDGSGLKVVHATAPEIVGPWTERTDIDLGPIQSRHVAAPGVVFDEKDRQFHMALQEDFTSLGGKIDYLVSSDGQSFSRVSVALEPIPHSGESGLYDPHLSLIKEERFLVYAGMPSFEDRTRSFTPQPDIYLARSSTKLWAGPWDRIGKILDHADIDWHHNRRDHPDYEWGIEGPQLVELPGGKILLNATCFLEGKPRGQRQRVFFALSDDSQGPYATLGPVLDPVEDSWESGENGHASAIARGDDLYLIYQARSASKTEGGRWNYGIAVFKLSDIEKRI